MRVEGYYCHNRVESSRVLEVDMFGGNNWVNPFMVWYVPRFRLLLVASVWLLYLQFANAVVQNGDAGLSSTGSPVTPENRELNETQKEYDRELEEDQGIKEEVIEGMKTLLGHMEETQKKYIRIRGDKGSN